MKRLSAIIIGMVALFSHAQQSYPEDFFDYPLDTRVSFTGKAPTITDFLVSFLNQDETSEVMGSLDDAWKHYVLGESQDPCVLFVVDEKNGYLRHTEDSQLCEGLEDDEYDEDSNVKSYIEMCYWNCADGKHKLLAENCITIIDGWYALTEYSGISFFIYDNDSHKLFPVSEEDIGAYIEPELDESATDTGKTLTTFENEAIVVYWLPQQGKDINVEIVSGTKRVEARLVWDGMRFKRQ